MAPQKYVPSDKRKGSLWQCCSILGAAGLGLFLLVFLVCGPNGRYGDMVEVEIRGLRADVEWTCVACDDGKSIRLLEEIDVHGLIANRYSSRTPDGQERQGNSLQSPHIGERWRSGLRYAVITRDIRGEWRRYGILPSDVSEAPAVSRWSGPLKILVIPRGTPFELPTASELSGLGINHQEARRPLGGSLPPTSEEVMKALDVAASLLEEKRLLAASDFVGLACRAAPRTLGSLATPDQRDAASRLEASYDEFVEVAGRDTKDGKTVLERLKELARRLPK